MSLRLHQANHQAVGCPPVCDTSLTTMILSVFVLQNCYNIHPTRESGEVWRVQNPPAAF